MAEQQLVSYIKEAKKSGQSDEQTKALLYKNGWTPDEVDDAFGEVNQPQPQPQAQPQPQPEPEPMPMSEPQPEPEPTMQPQPQPQVVSMESSMPKTKSSHLFLKLFVVLIILIIVGGAGLALALQQQIWNPSWNPFRQNPATVIGAMFTKMQSVKTYETKISGQVGILDQAGTKQGTLSFTADSQSDATSPSNPKATISFSGNLSAPGSTTPALSAKANAILSDKTFYFNFNNLSAPGMPEINAVKIQGKWFKLDQDSMNSLQLNLPLQLTSIASLQNIFTYQSQLADQKINGVDCYHYLGKLNVSEIGDVSAEIWIGKSDYMLYAYKLDKTISLSSLMIGTNIKLAVSLNASNSNFNKAVAVQVPSSSDKAETILLPIIKDEMISADLASIGSAADAIFTSDNSYVALCSKGLLNGYNASFGQNLIDFNNDLIKQGAKKPACFASATNYCVSSQMADGSFSCVGLNDVLGTAKCVSATTVCQ